jgi:sugar lactone lactonase YvrE
MNGLVYDARCIVGESLVWDDRRARLVWVDIIGQRVHALDPSTNTHNSWPTPGRITSIGLRDDGGAIAGLERVVALWDWEGDFRIVCEVEPDKPANRLNEGAVGPDGAFWIGTMQNNIAADDSPVELTEDAGRIYRYDHNGNLSRVSHDVFGITNTFVWPTPDRLVTADTTKNALYAYDVAPDTGQLSGRRTILHEFGRGLPDGSCLDAEGNVWTARVAGGSCLTRTTPEGEVLDVVELPCSWPTSCAFGGPDLDTLYVTSARFTMSDEHLAANPHEGGLFAVKPGVSGLPANRFGQSAAT